MFGNLVCPQAEYLCGLLISAPLRKEALSTGWGNKQMNKRFEPRLIGKEGVTSIYIRSGNGRSCCRM